MTSTATGSTISAADRRTRTIFSRRPAGTGCRLLSNDILDLGLRYHQSRTIIGLCRAHRRDAPCLSRAARGGWPGSLVVPFESGAYNTEATVSENLLFGTATGPALIGKALAAIPISALS